jgi:transposase
MSDILGVRGRAILEALIAGETDPSRLAELTRGRLKATRAELLDALHGRVTGHHRFMIQWQLTQVDALESAVASIEARIGDALGPFRAAVSLLTTMPGLSETTARALVVEIGTDMTAFRPWGISFRFEGWLLPAHGRERRQATLHATRKVAGGSNRR